MKQEMHSRALLSFLLFTLLLCSCNGKAQKSDSLSGQRVNKEAIRIHDIAIKLGTEYNTNPDSLRKAISILDEAIKIDTNYNEAYWNKAEYLTNLCEYDEADKVVDHQLIKMPNDPVLLVIKSFILEKKGKADMAKEYWQKAIHNFDRQWKEIHDPYNMLEKYLCIMMVEGKDKGLKAYKDERTNVLKGMSPEEMETCDFVIDDYYSRPREQLIERFWPSYNYRGNSSKTTIKKR